MFYYLDSNRVSWVRSIAAWMRRSFSVLTGHHQLHTPEPIGMFAGSLLERVYWDHR